jgi:parallel beta-helix repeat protein
VIVSRGFYTGSLTVNERLTIIGDRDAPVFSGGGSGIYVTLLSGASGSIITGIEVTNYVEGILIQNASNCGIYNNIMSSISCGGIVLQGSHATGNIVFDNAFQDTPTPINLTGSATGNTIYDNIINTVNSLIYNNNFLATTQITVLTTGGNSWNASYPTGGNYWSDCQSKYPSATEIDHSGIWNTPYIIDSNNKDYYPLMKPWTPVSGHDVAVLSVAADKTVIGEGFSGNFTIAVANDGQYSESFSLTVYANTSVLYTPTVNNLGSANQATLTSQWSTTGFAYGNYVIGAYAWPVPSETDIANNNFTLGVIKVTIPGDIDGDGYVFLSDLGIMAAAWTAYPTSPNWNPNADIVGEGQVFLGSLGVMAQHWTQHYP